MLTSATLLLAVAAPATAIQPASEAAKPRQLLEGQLSSAEIDAALRGKLIRYAPVGSADGKVLEEFHVDGRWTGTRYMRGPSPFAGHWYVSDDQLCVTAEQDLDWSRFAHGPVCRKVLRVAGSSVLQTKHISGDNDVMLTILDPVNFPRSLEVEK